MTTEQRAARIKELIAKYPLAELLILLREAAVDLAPLTTTEGR